MRIFPTTADDKRQPTNVVYDIFTVLIDLIAVASQIDPMRGILGVRQARLLENKNLGVVTSVMSLLMGLASRSPGNYEGLVPHVIHLLTRLVSGESTEVQRRAPLYT